MSLIPLQGNSILVDSPDSVASDASKTGHAPGSALVSWVMQRVDSWESQRERGYGKLWAEYWRTWRGKWTALDQTRESERSRLIAPALAQAIEASVSEIEEAIFGKDIWFDVPEYTDAQKKGPALASRDQLLDDMDRVNVPDAVNEAVLNAAIFGTGIVQVNVTVGKEKKPVRDKETHELKQSTKERVFVTVESIRPDEFIPDPAGKSVDEMLGVAIKRVKTQHSVLEKIENGTYRKDALAFVRPQHRLMNRDIDQEIDPQSILTTTDADEVEVVEYHGKVPLGLLEEALRPSKERTALDDLLEADDEDRDAETYVEAIITIGGGNVLLRAMSNPFTMKDRAILAFPYEKVPGRFWGRGVAEKGHNPQKALDATIRAYIDALAYVSAPMLGVDSGRIPRGMKLEVRPGKVWPTQGSPSEVLQPITLGQVNPALFQQASEMERMVQMGTGSFDTASAINSQSQSGANSLSSNSMLMGAFVKRAKRAIQNVDRNLLTPLVTKVLWRYMQFDPVRYPEELDFSIKTTLGIVAREAEAMQLTQMMGMLPDEYHPVKLQLARGIVENTALSNKDATLKMIDKILNPPPPTPEQQKQQQHMQQLQQEAAEAQLQGLLLDNQVKIATMKELLAKAAMESHKAQVADAQVQQEAQRIGLQQQDTHNFSEQNDIARKRLFIDNKKADAALISAHKKPSGSNS